MATMDSDEYGSGYKKGKLWMWIVLYVVIGLIVYGVIYVYFKQRNGGGLYGTSATSSPSALNTTSTPDSLTATPNDLSTPSDTNTP